MAIYDISSFETIMQSYFDNQIDWNQTKFAIERLMDCYDDVNNPSHPPVYQNNLPELVGQALEYLMDFCAKDEFTIEEIYAAMPVINKIFSVNDIAKAAENYIIGCYNGKDMYGLYPF